MGRRRRRPRRRRRAVPGAGRHTRGGGRRSGPGADRPGVGEDPAHAVADLGRGGQDHRTAPVGLSQVRGPPRHGDGQLLGETVDAGRGLRPAAGTHPGQQRRGPQVAPGEPPEGPGDILLETQDGGGRAVRVRPPQPGVGQQVGDQRTARDGADGAQPAQDPQLVESAHRAEVEERGPEPTTGQAQGRARAGPGGRGPVVRGGPRRSQLRGLGVAGGERCVGVVQHAVQARGSG